MRLVAFGYRCNNACIFCAQGALRDGEVAPVEAAAVERTLASLGDGESVAFVGGEPTLDDRLLPWVAAAVRRGASLIIVQTNGRRLAYPAYARALAEAASVEPPRGALRLDVSLHGSTEAMHDYHTQVSGSFRQTLTGITNAR